MVEGFGGRIYWKGLVEGFSGSLSWNKLCEGNQEYRRSLQSLGQFVALSFFELLQPLWEFSAKALHIVLSIDFPAHFLNASFELISGLFPRASWGLVLHPLTNQITIIISFLFFFCLISKTKKKETPKRLQSHGEVDHSLRHTAWRHHHP